MHLANMLSFFVNPMRFLSIFCLLALTCRALTLGPIGGCVRNREKCTSSSDASTFTFNSSSKSQQRYKLSIPSPIS